MGENPITKTIRLKIRENDSSYLELKNDCTALYISEKDGYKILSQYKYAYDDEKKTITMILEKEAYHSEFFYSETEGQLLTYDELISKFNEEHTVEKVRQSEKEYYEEEKDDEWFKEYYPGCDTYEKYEAMFVKREGFDTLGDFVNWYKQSFKDSYKAVFSAKITYAYEKENGKLTLTEKFTGVKNLISKSECEFSNESGYGYIDFNWANIKIREDDSEYSGTVNTDNKTISFESEEGKEKVTATYSEDIAAGTVTIKFKDKEYVCNFEGEKYTQE